MGGGSAPPPDPNMGYAALKSAQTGQQMLDWMKEQAQVTNAWAEQDRARYQDTFVPLQDQFIQEAQDYNTLARRNTEAQRATADVEQAAAARQAQQDRDLMARGIDPRSGRAATARERGAVDTALAAAGAGNMARRTTEATGRGMRMEAINLGQGGAVNPATSMSLSNSAGASGFGGAMRGLGQQSSILAQQHQQQLGQWRANQDRMGAIGGALGSVAGAFFSDENMKTDKKPVGRGAALRAVEDMPVETWRYKDGVADEGQHIGTYAQDFQSATGAGDGTKIEVQDAIGVITGAIQDLSAEVKDLKAGRGMRVAA
ncbi:tail fiber domain-containing protein [uncultured Roseobacter sp.]|uniref:tail fiber domain-containing protein n=1 Tax=uncultured Roseobacter sp. TaxID=114847 RepID=UPI00261D260D|nr:tail fiber domain-containing protein [uncultured Roseobacter sp.]